MPGTITVGLDGTDHSLAAADWAAAEASRRGTALRLVHAWVWQPLDAAVASDSDVQRQWAADVLREAEGRVTAAFPGLAVTTELLPAETVPTLLAEAAGADLLVLGSRGHGAVGGYLLGSVALKVLRQAVRPVVLVRPPRRDGPAPAADEVVVGVQEAGETGGPVLEFAFAAAAARDARVRAVRAWSVPRAFVWSPGSLYLADEAGSLEPLERRRLTEALRPWREKYPQVEVVEHVEIGGAADVLLSNGSGASLMVVGRRIPGPHDLRRIGSVTHAALHHALCPVAVVPHP
ncbi:universal stress protein [Streptomyces hesseae]|uniref:Universal stress protein n=1 Tax=Streptomyces hesseae TaxID=3075519 RepID=A0ABU2SL83_9ACTN|nr:universal stress protein [Streptomyces sp. DSM 40473]MDT0449553.1 universal stress protein [Streptomyces sp. DSM 40473]